MSNVSDASFDKLDMHITEPYICSAQEVMQTSPWLSHIALPLLFAAQSIEEGLEGGKQLSRTLIGSTVLLLSGDPTHSWSHAQGVKGLIASATRCALTAIATFVALIAPTKGLELLRPWYESLDHSPDALGESFCLIDTDKAKDMRIEELTRQLKAMCDLEQMRDDPSKGELDILAVKAQATLHLRDDVSAGVGCSGAMILRNECGQPFAVFKPAVMDVYADENPSHLQRVKKRLLDLLEATGSIGGEFRETSAGKGYIAERLAYELSELFFPGLVPPTTITTLEIGGKPYEGSLQAFERRPFAPLKEAFCFSDKSYMRGEETLSESGMMKCLLFEVFEKVSLFHFIMCNFDCHAENIFLLEEGGVALIDAGWSMSPQPPGGILASGRIRSLFGFKFMQFSEQLPHGKDRNFETFGREKIAELTTHKDQIATTVRELYEKWDPRSSVIEDRIQGVLNRIDLLMLFAEKKIPIRYLAKLTTQEVIEKLLREEGQSWGRSEVIRYLDRQEEPAALPSVNTAFEELDEWEDVSGGRSESYPTTYRGAVWSLRRLFG